MSFFTDFEDYEDCAPPGVLLPEISIESRYYKDLGLKDDTSNYDFLKELCKKGIKNHGIPELDKKEKYFSRLKSELEIFRDLGFVDYVLLNWDVLNYCHENDIPAGPGRGSAAGSLVLYLIGVTQG